VIGPGGGGRRSDRGAWGAGGIARRGSIFRATSSWPPARRSPTRQGAAAAVARGAARPTR